jgi:hypothetical protein
LQRLNRTAIHMLDLFGYELGEHSGCVQRDCEHPGEWAKAHGANQKQRIDKLIDAAQQVEKYARGKINDCVRCRIASGERRRRYPVGDEDFAQRHPVSESQPKALAGAIHAYATHIDRLADLGPVAGQMTEDTRSGVQIAGRTEELEVNPVLLDLQGAASDPGIINQREGGRERATRLALADG